MLYPTNFQFQPPKICQYRYHLYLSPFKPQNLSWRTCHFLPQSLLWENLCLLPWDLLEKFPHLIPKIPLLLPWDLLQEIPCLPPLNMFWEIPHLPPHNLLKEGRWLLGQNICVNSRTDPSQMFLPCEPKRPGPQEKIGQQLMKRKFQQKGRRSKRGKEEVIVSNLHWLLFSPHPHWWTWMSIHSMIW